MSIRKELTAQNVLLGFQHVLVSNVWLDPVFVAGAIGLPIALSSNMINAIFIVTNLDGDVKVCYGDVRKPIRKGCFRLRRYVPNPSNL